MDYRKVVVDKIGKICEENKLSLLYEYEIFKGRKIRADFCIPELRVVVEVQGGLWNKGSHRGHFEGNKALKDFEKFYLYSLNKWIIILLVPSELKRVKDNILVERLNEVIEKLHKYDRTEEITDLRMNEKSQCVVYSVGQRLWFEKEIDEN